MNSTKQHLKLQVAEHSLGSTSMLSCQIKHYQRKTHFSQYVNTSKPRIEGKIHIRKKFIDKST
jgi:hypothetical protein